MNATAAEQRAAEEVVSKSGLVAEDVLCALRGDIVYRAVTLVSSSGERVVGTNKNSYTMAARAACRKAIEAGWLVQQKEAVA